jgi:hypothetical protein
MDGWMDMIEQRSAQKGNDVPSLATHSGIMLLPIPDANSYKPPVLLSVRLRVYPNLCFPCCEPYTHHSIRQSITNICQL